MRRIAANLGILGILAIVMLAGCSYRPQLPQLPHMGSSQVETTMPPTWFLIEAPFTKEFPSGYLQAPLSKWPQVTTFDTSAACERMIEQAENDLQRPVQCAASDDPRLKKPAEAIESKE